MSFYAHGYPHSQFFRLQVGDDVRAALDPRLDHLRQTKIRRVQKVRPVLIMWGNVLTVYRIYGNWKVPTKVIAVRSATSWTPPMADVDH